MKIGPPPPQFGPPGRGLPDRSAVRAEGFAELGMFGLSRHQVAPIFAGAPRPASVAPQDPSQGASAVGRTVPAESGPRQAPVKRAENLRATASPTIPNVDMTNPQPPDTGGPVDAAPAPTVAEQDCCDEPVPTGAIPARSRPLLRAPAASVILREDNGQAEIIVGSPDRDPAARLALRRLVETLLARSGLTLAQFQLNGAPVAPDFLGRTGGSDGSRSH